MSYHSSTPFELGTKSEFDRNVLSQLNQSICNELGIACIENRENMDLYNLCAVFADWFISMYPARHACNIWYVDINKVNLDKVIVILKEMLEKYHITIDEIVNMASKNMFVCIKSKESNRCDYDVKEYFHFLNLFKNNLVNKSNPLRVYIDDNI